MSEDREKIENRKILDIMNFSNNMIYLEHFKEKTKKLFRPIKLSHTQISNKVCKFKSLNT